MQYTCRKLDLKTDQHEQILRSHCPNSDQCHLGLCAAKVTESWYFPATMRVQMSSPLVMCLVPFMRDVFIASAFHRGAYRDVISPPPQAECWPRRTVSAADVRHSGWICSSLVIDLCLFVLKNSRAGSLGSAAIVWVAHDSRYLCLAAWRKLFQQFYWKGTCRL